MYISDMIQTTQSYFNLHVGLVENLKKKHLHQRTIKGYPNKWSFPENGNLNFEEYFDMI